jgi:hypothetical protein
MLAGRSNARRSNAGLEKYWLGEVMPGEVMLAWRSNVGWEK